MYSTGIFYIFVGRIFFIMKRLLVLCVTALVAVLAASDAHAGRFGIKGSVGFPDQNFKGSSPVGYQVGITWQWNLPLWFAIQPDLVYSVTPQAIEGDVEALKVGTVKLPVNVQWGPRFSNRNIRLFAQASPFVGYNVAAMKGGEKLSIKEIGNELAYGAGLGVGLQLWCLQITGQYNWNLADFKKESLQGINIKQPDGVSLSLALMFGKNKDKVKKSKKQSSVADEDYEY